MIPYRCLFLSCLSLPGVPPPPVERVLLGGGQGVRPAAEDHRERQHPAQPGADPAGRAHCHQHPQGKGLCPPGLQGSRLLGHLSALSPGGSELWSPVPTYLFVVVFVNE